MNNITLTQQSTVGGANTISIKASLSAVITKKKPGVYVSYCPALDLYSQGDTRKEAEKNIIEATHLFIESCLERNTLNEVLTDCGFHPVNRPATKKKSKPAPKLSGSHRQINFPAELPVMVY